jgi:hypothetical protein
MQGCNWIVEAHLRNITAVSPADAMKKEAVVMTKLILATMGVAGLAGGLAALAQPALAQDSSSQAEAVVFGTDPCPRDSSGAIVICRHLPESMRYRMPESYRPKGARQEGESWGQKSKSIMTMGATGPGSCSAVGPGGHIGCLIQEINQAKKESRESADQATAPQ